MSRRRPLLIYMRGWAGALLFAAARVSGGSVRAVCGGGYSAGVPDGERLRAALHGVVCASGLIYGFLACSADTTNAAGGHRSGTAGADRVVGVVVAAAFAPHSVASRG